MFFQLKPDGPRHRGAFIPYLSVDFPENYRRIGLRVDFEFNKSKILTRKDSKPLKPDRWYTLRTEVNLSNGSDGFAKVFLDNRLIASYKGYTGPDSKAPLVNF